MKATAQVFRSLPELKQLLETKDQGVTMTEPAAEEKPSTIRTKTNTWFKDNTAKRKNIDVRRNIILLLAKNPKGLTILQSVDRLKQHSHSTVYAAMRQLEAEGILDHRKDTKNTPYKLFTHVENLAVGSDPKETSFNVDGQKDVHPSSNEPGYLTVMEFVNKYHVSRSQVYRLIEMKKLRIKKAANGYALITPQSCFIYEQELAQKKLSTAITAISKPIRKPAKKPVKRSLKEVIAEQSVQVAPKRSIWAKFGKLFDLSGR